MSTRLAVAVALGVLLGASAPMQAHHSFSAVYDASKPITLKGVVKKLGWSNPHSHIYIDVEAPDGSMVTWEIESAGANQLLQQGLRKEDFVGAEVIVKGFLAKDGTPSANASSFTLVGLEKEFTSDQ